MASPAVAQEQQPIVAEGTPATIDVPALATAQTIDGEAKAGEDYETLTAPAETEPRAVEVTTTDDGRVEGPERFDVVITPLVGEPSTVTVTITDNDAPSLTITGASVSEGDGSAVLPVSLAAEAERDVVVDASIAPGTAGAGDARSPDRVTIPRGERTASLTVPIVNDDEDETDETFTVSAPGAPDATVTIRNDDLRSLAVGDALVLEGDGDNAVVRVPVTLSGPTFRTVTARFSTLDGTAARPRTSSRAWAP
jgi:hypothetical protein